MADTDIVYHSMASAGQAIAQGAQQYMENRRQSKALDGQLDRIGSMLSAFAQQHPELMTDADHGLVGKMSKAPAGNLASKKATLADALLWLDDKNQQAKAAQVGAYYDSLRQNSESQRDTRLAIRELMLPPDPDLSSRTHGIDGLPMSEARAMDVQNRRFAGALRRYENADPIAVRDAISGPTSQRGMPVETTMPSGTTVLYSPTTGKYDIVPPKVPDRVSFSPADRASLMRQRKEYVDASLDPSLPDSEKKQLQRYIQQLDRMLLDNTPAAGDSNPSQDPLGLFQ